MGKTDGQLKLNLSHSNFSLVPYDLAKLVGSFLHVQLKRPDFTLSLMDMMRIKFN